jgi:hypothetical protein
MASFTASNSTAGTWYTWVSDGTTSTGANTVWNGWVASSATSTGVTTTSNEIWCTWNDESSTQYVARTRAYIPPPETELQKQARLEREAAWKQQEEERKRKEAEALQRAEDLLMLQLSEKQRSDWKKHKAFDVISQSGKRFRIRNERSMNVDEYDANNKMVARHCIVSQTHVPAPDQYVMQKLMLEHQEADFMRIANHRVH